MRIFLLLFFSVLALSLCAQQQRALIIGIDRYGPPAGANVSAVPAQRTSRADLKGCKNDAAAMKEMIMARYGFEKEHINVLYDAQATRQNILGGLAALLEKSNKGDIAFIYYAGHGSQVKNSLSREPDGLDESLVPADAWKEGVEDLRDKTLAALLNKFIDKGVVLTCIFDCCHSGSIGRGLQTRPPAFRYMPPDHYDAKDASNPPAPEKRPESRYLILTATQDNELAQEQVDEQGASYGAFTLALLQAMSQQQPQASASGLFLAARAILKNNGRAQEPVMAGDPGRHGATLFGRPQGALSGRLWIPVLSARADSVVLQGGWISGLQVENELANAEGSVRLKVTKVLGPDRSQAVVTKGQAGQVKAGNLFGVTNWVSSSAPYLKVYIPFTGLKYGAVSRFAQEVRAARQEARLRLVTDFDREDPDVSVYFHEGKWRCNDPRRGMSALTSFSAGELAKIARDQKISVNIPPPQALADSLKSAFAAFRNIRVVTDPSAAQYTLMGTLAGDQLSYGWIKTQPSAKDSLEMMPVQTKAFPLYADTESASGAVAGALFEYAVRLSKIQAWFNLRSPAGANYPFHLEIRNKNTGRALDTSGARMGDRLALYLVRDKVYDSWDARPLFVYVFAIDKEGKMVLLYPDRELGESSRLPRKDADGAPLPEMLLTDGLQVAEPAGTDNYYLLATDEALPHYSYIMNQEGVRGTAGGAEGLSALFHTGNLSSRGVSVITPDNWLLQRISVKARH